MVSTLQKIQGICHNVHGLLGHVQGECHKKNYRKCKPSTRITFPQDNDKINKIKAPIDSMQCMK